MTNKEIPVLLLTGYLGSGKTTLVNKILANRKGIKFAVIVNDIGEVNIDADLIAKGGVVGQKDDSLVALQNGCICCTLKMDLVQQICDITAMGKFDYIVIEASGICEPEPIAQTICSIPSMGEEYVKDGVPRLDCIVTVVDALRMRDEFNNGSALLGSHIGEEDLERLVIQQIEFCNVILLNKASEISSDELGKVEQIVRTLQPKAKIVECDYAEVDFDSILNTRLFDFDATAGSATWVSRVEGGEPDDEEVEHFGHEHHEEHHHHEDEEHEADEHHHHEDEEHGHHEEHDADGHHHHEDEEHEADEHHHHEDEEHGHHEEHEADGHHHRHEDEHEEHHHHHHHHHDHEGGEVEEYGIGTFVYYRRQPLDINKFDYFISRKWPKNVIRTKGLCYFSHNTDTCFLFEQAGSQVGLKNIGQWFATMPQEQLDNMLAKDPILQRDWDPDFGDRMQKLVFIGQHLDKEQIARDLDDCLDHDTLVY